MVGITQFDFAHVRKCVTNKICYCSGYNLENLSLATNGWSLGFSILRAKIFRSLGFSRLELKYLSSLISFFNFILVLCSSRVVLLKYIMNLTVLP
ncbi:hypothetical protein RIR_jg6688.t1 [Rhizophagus irregularis DAOM 181602=DAOM 197198]|nr:hypothetical protein RIR_jg6688.t1 [Rhizophagus irregularis DAOM 181602=DAOM 197198]